MLQLGHRQIAFIGGPDHLISAQLRWMAFMHAMRKYQSSLEADFVLCAGDFKLGSGQRAVRELLAAQRRSTAIITANDLMALGALGELKRAGLRVPTDISVLGCDDIWLASVTDPPLTTISIPRAQIGRAAVEAVLETNSAENRPGREVKIQTRLVVRESTGPAPPTR